MTLRLREFLHSFSLLSLLLLSQLGLLRRLCLCLSPRCRLAFLGFVSGLQPSLWPCPAQLVSWGRRSVDFFLRANGWFPRLIALPVNFFLWSKDKEWDKGERQLRGPHLLVGEHISLAVIHHEELVELQIWLVSWQPSPGTSSGSAVFAHVDFCFCKVRKGETGSEGWSELFKRKRLKIWREAILQLIAAN